MKFRLMSDLHLNICQGKWFPDVMENEKDQILLIAGDIWEGTKSLIFRREQPDEVQWLRVMCERFREVVMVFGNHDYWDENIDSLNTKFFDGCSYIGMPENFHLLDNHSIMIDDVKIIGSTLWTNFDNQNPLTLYNAENMMLDYKYIKKNGYANTWEKVKPLDILKRHIYSVSYIQNQLTDYHGKSIVLTHHCPSFRGKSKIWLEHNGLYCSDLDDMIYKLKPSFWCYGHIHEHSVYGIGNTMLLSNPLGYIGHNEQSNFKHDMVFEL